MAVHLEIALERPVEKRLGVLARDRRMPELELELAVNVCEVDALEEPALRLDLPVERRPGHGRVEQ